ncbi:MAG TPA: hypothetical protein VF271_10390 [Rhodanobacteraceae bacterium]
MKISRLKLAGLLVVMLAAFLMATPATFAASPTGYMVGSSTTTSTKHKKKAVHKKATHKKTTHKKTAHKEKATHEKTSGHAKTTSHKRSEHHAKADKKSTKSQSAATTKRASHAKSTTHRSVATRGGNGKVWVNTDSKVYHCSGSKLSGNTKQGEYMSESQAKAKGYRPSNGRACGSR